MIPFLISLIVLRTINADTINPSDIWLDRVHGSIIYRDKPTMIYDGHIILPVYITLPHSVTAPVSVLMDERCDTVQYVEDIMQGTIKALQEYLPDLSNVFVRKNIKDLILSNGTLNIRNKNVDLTQQRILAKSHNRSITWKDISSKMRLSNNITNNFKNEMNFVNDDIINNVSKRKKRVAPLIMLGGAALTAIAGWLGFNTYTIATMNTAIKTMDANQKYIYKELESTRDVTKILNFNSLELIHSVQEISHKIDHIFSKFECDLSKHDAAIELATTWANLAPNSFLRALNSILLGQMSVDILPRNYLQDLLTHFYEFKDTIYEAHPELIYQGAKTMLIRLTRDPPTIEAIIYIPKIYQNYFGDLYKQQSCSWRHIQNGKATWVTLMRPAEAIYTPLGHNQWSTRGCKMISDNFMCDKSEMLAIEEPCVTNLRNNLNDSCPIKLSNQATDVLVLSFGVLICPHVKEVSLVKRSPIGIPETKKIGISNATLITGNDGDSVIVNGMHYLLGNVMSPISVTHVPFVNTTLENETSLEDYFHNVHFQNVSFNDLEPLDKINLPHHYILYLLVGLSILAMLILTIRMYRSESSKRKIIGYLYNRVGYTGSDISSNNVSLKKITSDA